MPHWRRRGGGVPLAQGVPSRTSTGKGDPEEVEEFAKCQEAPREQKVAGCHGQKDWSSETRADAFDGAKAGLAKEMARATGGFGPREFGCEAPRRKRGRIESRCRDLREMMRNMDKADQKQLHQATAESQRIQPLFASVDQDLRKAQQKKAEPNAKVVEILYQREKEEQRAKNEESEEKFIGSEVEDAEKELHYTK